MRKEKKGKKFIKTPIYKGGIKAMRTFVSTELKYPDDALQNKTEGTVHLRYSINRAGKTFNIKIVKGVGHGCNEEAKRIIGLFTFDMPKNRAGKVIFHKTLQIHFRLPKVTEKKLDLTPPKPVQTDFSYSYTVTTTTKKEDGTSSYGYSIPM